MTSYIKHAQALTLDQWREEIWGGPGDGPSGWLYNAIEREIDSLPRSEPMLSLVKSLRLDAESCDNVNWIMHSVAVAGGFCSFPTTAYFCGETEPYQAGRSGLTGVQPLISLGLADKERELYVIGVEAVLRINDQAQMSSEIIEVFTEEDPADPERWDVDWGNTDGCLLTMPPSF